VAVAQSVGIVRLRAQVTEFLVLDTGKDDSDDVQMYALKRHTKKQHLYEVLMVVAEMSCSVVS
jgi:hypothetical protein